MKSKLKNIVFLVALLAFGLFMVNPTYIKPSSDVAREIAESYMRKQTSVEQFDITTAELWYDTGHVQFIYSVKPTESGMEKWSQGGGQKTDDGWIKNKTSFIKYYRIGNFYFTGLSLKFKLPNK